MASQIAQMRSKLHAHSRSTSFKRTTSNSLSDQLNGTASESSPLLHSSAPNGSPSDHQPNIFQRILTTAWLVLTSNYANVLLVAVPVGIVLGALDMDPIAVFVVNFLAIVPLAALLSFATEELSAKMGQTIGGLMNATFGNAVELIVSIIALREGQIRIVQSSMLGSILSNILLVLGCCFISSGLRRPESVFNTTVASTMSSLMAVASASLIIPATLYASIANSGHPGDSEQKTLLLSRGTAIIILLLYCLYLFFQLRTHAYLFDAENQEPEEAIAEEDDEEQGLKEGDILAPIPAMITLVLVTVLVALCAEYLVDSIDAIVQRAHISKTFIGLILLPIVGNAAEHVTAVVVSWKGKMDLALGVAIGSSMQIALFVTPFLVILGWAMDQPMTLQFKGFETVVFFLSVLVVNYLIQDGRSNYLEGAMCIGLYVSLPTTSPIIPKH